MSNPPKVCKYLTMPQIVYNIHNNCFVIFHYPIEFLCLSKVNNTLKSEMKRNKNVPSLQKIFRRDYSKCYSEKHNCQYQYRIEI